MTQTLRHIAAIIIACLTLFPVSARKTDTDNCDARRIVLKAAKPIETILLNSDLNVEVIFKPEYAGYIVYSTDNTSAPRLQCISSDNTLIINTDAATAAVSSRVCVYCDRSMTTVINNGSGRIVIPDTKHAGSSLTLMNNGSGDIGSRKLDVKDIAIVCNGSGRIGIKKMKADHVAMSLNGCGDIYAGGRADEAAISINGSGTAHLNRTKIKDIVATVNGLGDLKCRFEKTLSVNITGGGSVEYYSRGAKPRKGITVNGSAVSPSTRVTPSTFKHKKQ